MVSVADRIEVVLDAIAAAGSTIIHTHSSAIVRGYGE